MGIGMGGQSIVVTSPPNEMQPFVVSHFRGALLPDFIQLTVVEERRVALRRHSLLESLFSSLVINVGLKQHRRNLISYLFFSYRSIGMARCLHFTRLVH